MFELDVALRIETVEKMYKKKDQVGRARET